MNNDTLKSGYYYYPERKLNYTNKNKWPKFSLEDKKAVLNFKNMEVKKILTGIYECNIERKDRIDYEGRQMVYGKKTSTTLRQKFRFKKKTFRFLQKKKSPVKNPLKLKSPKNILKHYF